MLIIFLTAAVLPAGAQSFSDLPANHWAYDAINKLVEAGIVEGYPDGEYKGQRTMNRYEMESELRVLGADLKRSVQTVEKLEAKIPELKIPGDDMQRLLQR